jgi:hypothetical protein
MTTRSNLNYSILAEDLQRSLDAALENSARTPSANHVHSNLSPFSSASPGITVHSFLPSPVALQTALGQKFSFLKEISKETFIVWYPTYLTYKNQVGTRSLPQCMEPQVQNALMFLLSQFANEPPSKRFASSAEDLYMSIDQHFQLSVISNYRGLLLTLYMKDTDKFNRQAVDVYIQHVINLLNKYPLMFDLNNGDTTHKNFTIVFLDSL